MKTDDLIALMSESARPVDTGWLNRATWLCAFAALAATAGLVLLTLGARLDFGTAWASGPVIAKAAFGASVAGLALALFHQSLRPGLNPAPRLPALALPLLVVVGWAALALAQAPTEQWGTLVMGRNWRACLIAVPLYAMLPLAALVAVARRGAPTNARLTGGCAGLASAGLATVAYSLHCPDDAAPFLATWYPLAIAVTAGFGAVALPRILRWP